MPWEQKQQANGNEVSWRKWVSEGFLSGGEQVLGMIPAEGSVLSSVTY